MISSVAVVGAGTIGLSWAALFAHAGLSVSLTDPREDLAELVAEQMPGLAASLGTSTQQLLSRIRLADSLQDAVANAEWVQENGPERLEFKQKLFAEIADATPATAVLASSSSGIVASLIAEQLTDEVAGRLLIAHPFNPPALMPLVEIVPSPRTSDSAIATAQEFFTSLGKTPVLEHKEIQGFVANRLQAVVLKEAFSLVLQGVVSVAELDTAMKASLGARWATIGPFESYHLGGGPGGVRHMFEHLGAGLTGGEASAAGGEPNQAGSAQGGSAQAGSAQGEPVAFSRADVERLILEVEATYGVGQEAYSRLTAERDRKQIAVNQAVRSSDFS